MPKPDLDEPVLLEALAAVGVEARRTAWDADVDWSSFDLVVLRTPWDYVDRFDDFAAWMAQAAAVTTVLNPPTMVTWNLHKRYLFDLEAAFLLPVALAWNELTRAGVVILGLMGFFMFFFVLGLWYEFKVKALEWER